MNHYICQCGKSKPKKEGNFTPIERYSCEGCAAYTKKYEPRDDRISATKRRNEYQRLWKQKKKEKEKLKAAINELKAAAKKD